MAKNKEDKNPEPVDAKPESAEAKPEKAKPESKPEKVKKGVAVSVVDEVRRTGAITSKQLNAFQKETLGKAVVEKSKTSNGN